MSNVDEHDKPDHHGKDPFPRWVLPLDLAYALALLLLLMGRDRVTSIHDLLPDPAGPIPLAVVWWGALGGLSISLVGVGDHFTEWNNRYNIWHALRPFMGAIFGSVAYLILHALVLTTGATQPIDGGNPVVYYIAAFLVGYREETFRELVKQATDLLFRPGRAK